MTTLGSLATNRSHRIFEAFDRLPMGGILELNEESDPRSLRNEFQQLRAGRFSWNARNHGSGRWTVRLERIDERAEAPLLGELDDRRHGRCIAAFANEQDVGIGPQDPAQPFSKGSDVTMGADLYPILGTIAQNMAGPRDLGVATSALQFCRSLGGAFGAAAFWSLLLAFLPHELASATPDELAAGFHSVFLVASGLAVICAIVSLAITGEHQPAGVNPE